MQYKIPYVIENKIAPAALENVSLDGEIGARFDRFIHERISGEFAIREIWREAEECFADQYDDEFEGGMWRGEFWGKLLLSAARVCRIKRDEKLKSDIRASVYRMLAYQTPSGYLSTYRQEDKIFPANTEISRKQQGWDCYFNWNIWGQKYTMWALIECAQLLEDALVLHAAERMADHLAAQLSRLGVHLTDTGVMSGMAAGSMMKPLLVLYRLSGKKEYLDICLDAAAQWDQDGDVCPNLIRNALSGNSPASWYRRGDEGWYAKAYEMMSSFDGICELYRVTGNRRYFDAVVAMWATLEKYEANILGSVGYCEQFTDGRAQADAATEVCDVLHWMRLSYELFCLTGEGKYAEAMERGFLAAFLAGVYDDGKNGAFFVRAAGRHWAAVPQVETKYQHCCVNNAARGFTNMAEAVIMQDADSYYINTYIPYRGRFGKTTFRISAGYIDHGSVSIIVRDAEVGKTIRLRLPSWSPSLIVKMNGESEETVRGVAYYDIPVTACDMLVQLRFDMTPEVIDFPGTFTDYSDKDYHRNRFLDGGTDLCGREIMLYHPMSIIRRGPVMLARSKRVGCAEADMFSGETVFGKERSCTARVLRHEHFLVICRVTLNYDGVAHEYVMCDYASAANRETEDPHFFTMYV